MKTASWGLHCDQRMLAQGLPEQTLCPFSIKDFKCYSRNGDHHQVKEKRRMYLENLEDLCRYVYTRIHVVITTLQRVPIDHRGPKSNHKMSNVENKWSYFITCAKDGIFLGLHT